MQGGNPFKLEVLAFIEFPSEHEAKTQEKLLHEQFTHLHHEREWYHDNKELRDYIREHAEPYYEL